MTEVEAKDLRQLFGELRAVLASDHSFEDRFRASKIAERLAHPAAGILGPELVEEFLAYHRGGDVYAAFVLAGVLAGACGADALPVLLPLTNHPLLSDDESGLQVCVIEILIDNPFEALPHVLACATSVDARLHRIGIWALGLLEAAARPHVGLAEAALDDPDPYTRSTALGTVETLLGRDHPQVIALTLAALHDPTCEVRTHAVHALAHREGAEITEVLVTAADDPHPEVRWLVVFALRRREGAAVRAALHRLADDPEERVRQAVTGYSWG